jgi:hypothetical protein
MTKLICAFPFNIIWHIYCDCSLSLVIKVICSYACNSAARFKIAVGFSSGGEEKWRIWTFKVVCVKWYMTTYF